jgi:hypothetical protein
MADATITEHMAVVGADGAPVGTVDHLDAQDTIKLTKDEQGQHHWIGMTDVARVDAQVHLHVPAPQAMQRWMTTPPARE